MKKSRRLSAAPALWLAAGVLTLTTGCPGPQEPTLGIAHQSMTELSGAESVTLGVSYAVGAPFTLRWTATAGTVLERDAPRSTIVYWTAPNCIPEGAPMPVVTATLTDEQGRSASTEFHFQETELFRCVVNESAPMSRPRVSHTATRLASGQVLVVGGVSEFVSTETPARASVPSVLESSAELYEPSTRTWAPTGALSQPRYDHQAHLLASGRVLVIGGLWSTEGASEPRAATTLELYEPSTGTWTVVSDLGEMARVKHSVLLTSGRVLLLGQEATGQPRHALYDPEANTWSPATAPASDIILDNVIRLASGKLLAIGTRTIPGRNGAPPTTVQGAWSYAPDTDTWTPTGAMKRTEAFFDTSLALLPSGEVLCLYRHEEKGNVLAELYQPGTNTWLHANTPSAAAPARFATGPLHSGQVLFSTYASNWKMHVFDPVQKIWLMLGHLPGPLPWGMTVTPLPSGQTLLVGGQLRSEQPLSTTPQRTVWLHAPRSP
ncbi:Kelch repeat-containing protein [Cystobacter ferrugineus]|uniref:Galactose oxidase n=1 Tax=Cystobacter ferrugineus TaxID=83449 RepID=A0A1L9B1W4_9BACT|nr:kelch repeat-containing protein [Cystobacter ferrugineus]OJH36242.1 hypothetical protein BON30_34355 [Cystobacter ferrugineus]